MYKAFVFVNRSFFMATCYEGWPGEEMIDRDRQRVDSYSFGSLTSLLFNALEKASLKKSFNLHFPFINKNIYIQLLNY